MTKATNPIRSEHAFSLHSLKTLLMLWCLTVSLSASAAVRYVDANSLNPVPPFTSWQTAAREIQRAVDLSSAGDEILVTNGVYSSGISRPVQGSTLTNRVCLDIPVTLRSVNGPLVTIIEGYQTTPRWADSSVAVRCAYVASGAVLEGFTLRNGDTRNVGDFFMNQSGGGVFCQSPNSLVRRCIIQGNVAYGEGGGAFGGRLENCLIIRNSATNGASGGCSNILVNCTVTRNALGNSPGGVRASIVYNSIVWENFGNPPNHSDTVFRYSCTEPLPSGPGNISADPLFQLTHTNDFHLRSDSPCLEKGDNALTAGPTDLDGNPRQAGARVDMGAYEFGPVPPRVTTEPNDQLAVLGQSALFSVTVAGSGPLRYQWWFGTEPLLWQTNATLLLTNVQVAQAGGYTVAITNEFGWTNSRTALLTVVEPVTRYVDINSPEPSAPFTTWATASRTIQQAVDVANAGDHIVVTNGVYSDGGRAVEGTLTNRVALNKAVTVRSVNGAAFTTIQGRRADTGTNGPGAVRCAYLTNGASLIGFTLTGGATLSAGLGTLTTGGGAWCASNAVISRCVITGNCAFTAAGGVGGGVLENCVLFGNTAQSAGGALWSTLRNCTVMGNSAGETPGVYVCNVVNSIVLSNTTPSTSAEFLASSFSYSCTAPLAPGVGNVSFDPRVQDLAAGDLRLRSDSPCMNRGNNAAAAGPIDLAGNPRIFGATVDMGAYEFQGAFVPIAPSILLQPTNQTVPAGVDALFAVVAQGTPPLSYQWRFEGADLPLKTEPVLVITNAQAVNVGSYTVRISNQGGPITSSPATLSIRPSMTLFVDAASANPQSPFNTWATAARSLQDAADLAFAGDAILVTNGIYSTGGKFDGNQTNRIVVPRGVKVRSVNGPLATVIRGFYSPSQYTSWSRGAYLSEGSSLTGFTIKDSAAGQGGGVYAESPFTRVTNCIIEHNYAGIGGGAYGGTLYNCLLWRNGAEHGGGAASATLFNCTVVRNQAGSLPGAVRKLPFSGPSDYGISGCSANNSIIRLNTFATFEGVGSGSLTNCCISPYFTYGGWGNFTDDPLFVDAANGDFRLRAASPCIDAGKAFGSPGNQDLDGQPRIHGSQIDVGAYEFQGVFAPVPVNITQHPASQQVLLGDLVYLTVSAEGTGPLFYQWQFNGADMPGQTNAYLSFLSVQANQLGSYTVRVTGRTGSPTSNPAIISKVTGSQRYVDSTSLNPLSPYNSWATAARTIQAAVDVAVAGDEIVVTNGTYTSGGRMVSAPVTNRVVITNSMVVRSVNGPLFTTIIGATNTRCAYLGSSASLVGFTLTRGTADQGGGVFCLSTNAVIENCIIVSNTASWSGGGALGGTLTNCVLSRNSAYNGGGASAFYGENRCVLNSCIVSSNTAAYGGGVEGVELNNCLVLGNRAGNGGGVYAYNPSVRNCTIVANTATNVGGGLWATNGLVANSILFYNSAPEWQNWTRGNHFMPLFVNCCTQPTPYESYEVYAKTIITNEPAFVDLAGGNLRLPSGSPCVNAGTNFFAKGATDLDGNPRIVWGTVDIGAYEYQQGTTSNTLYVDSNSPNPTAPFASWSTAAKSIQDAVDSASAGSVVLVTNGVYSSGGRLFGTLSNRVLVTKPISLRSVNGPRFTFIEGFRDTAPDPNLTSRGSNSVRCVYLAAGASISGFTLTNGATRAPGPVSGNGTETYGGGVYCVSPSAAVSNCILIGNFANDSGGGVFGGTVFNSLILQNSAYWGAGAAESALVNCTVVRNGYMFAQTARKLPFTGPWGAGIYDCSAINSIIYSNAFFSWNDDNYSGQCAFTNSCTTPMPFEVVDTIDADPLFMDPAAGNFRLRADSPCINRGLIGSNPGDVDLDGLPRVIGNAIDLGAYEFQGGTAIPFGDWLAGYGLPSDGSADTVDSDNDGANNWQEWLAGSNPTNAASAFKLLTPAVVGNDIVVQWQGQPGMVYSLERGTGLVEPAFQVLATNLVVKPGSNSVAPYYPATYTDTNAAVDPLRLYRVRIGK